MKMWDSILGLTQFNPHQVKGSGVTVSCGVGHRCSSNLALLWHRLADAALIRPLAWEHPYAAYTALEGKKKKKKKEKKKREREKKRKKKK